MKILIVLLAFTLLISIVSGRSIKRRQLAFPLGWNGLGGMVPVGSFNYGNDEKLLELLLAQILRQNQAFDGMGGTGGLNGMNRLNGMGGVGNILQALGGTSGIRSILEEDYAGNDDDYVDFDFDLDDSDNVEYE